MNERIKAIVEQAKQATPRGLAPDDWLEVYHTKFAELIVKECVEKLKETKKVELPFLQSVNEYAQELPLSVYIAELNGHFGVEE